MVSTRSSAVVSPQTPLRALVSGADAAPVEWRVRVLEAWHLLSLDAPTVATVWLLAAAKTFAVRLPVVLAPAMFLLVWLLYALDRLLDARRALSRGEAQELAARHYFHHRHRRVLGAVIAVVAVTLIPLIAVLPQRLLVAYAGLGVMLVGWLMLVHGAPRWRARLLSKELAVGVFFAPAVMMPVLLSAGAAWIDAVVATLLLTALCAVNCMAIEGWETRGRARPVTALSLAAICGVVTACNVRGPWPLFVALALAALLLAGLDGLRGRLTATTLRAAADLVLLTPLLLFGLLR